MDASQSTLDVTEAERELESRDDVPFRSPLTADAARETPPDVTARAGVAAASVRRGRYRHLLPSRSAKLVAGLVVVGLIVLFGLVAPFFVQSPTDSDNPPLQPPSSEYC